MLLLANDIFVSLKMSDMTDRNCSFEISHIVLIQSIYMMEYYFTIKRNLNHL